VQDAHLGRRAFLKTAALSMAGLAGAAGLADCGSPAPKPPPPKRVRPATAAEWAVLAASLAGRLVRPADPSYPTDRLLYNPLFDDLYPAAIAYCATSDDVARSISFARDHGIAVAPRAGGHSYGGYSSGDGRLVIDVTSMRAVAPTASQAPPGSAGVQAGARLIDVYNALGNAGRLLPGGSCPSVGIAGLALGGGVGVFARQFGITADNIEALTIVTADSRTLSCSPSSNADLFWACRGGGGGNFGIVTDFTFKTYPLPDVTLFTYDFPWAAAAAVLGSWQHWTVSLDPAVWSNCQLLSGDGTTARIAGVSCSSSAQTAAWLQPLLAAIGTPPTYAFVGGESYINAMMVEAGCSALTVAACHLETATPSGSLSRQAFRASSNYVARPMDAASLQRVVDSVDAFAASTPALGGGMVFDALGGAVNTVAPGATAFVHRGFLASIQTSYNWTSDATASEIAAGDQWLAQVQGDVYDISTGAYQNYIDPSLTGWAAAYYGSNLARLESVKAVVDPDDVFTFAQSIPLAR